MPQMAPISWLTLFIMFSLILILFCMMNYFCYTPQMPIMPKDKMTYSHYLTWKW